MTKILGIEITNNLLEFTLIDDEEEIKYFIDGQQLHFIDIQFKQNTFKVCSGNEIETEGLITQFVSEIISNPQSYKTYTIQFCGKEYELTGECLLAIVMNEFIQKILKETKIDEISVEIVSNEDVKVPMISYLRIKNALKFIGFETLETFCNYEDEEVTEDEEKEKEQTIFVLHKEMKQEEYFNEIIKNNRDNMERNSMMQKLLDDSIAHISSMKELERDDEIEVNDLINKLNEMKESPNESEKEMKELCELVKSYFPEYLTLNLKRMFNYSQLDQYTMYLSMMYFNTIDDMINIIFASKKFEFILERFFYNPVPVNERTINFFPKLRTLCLYSKYSDIIEKEQINSFEYYCPVPYYLKNDYIKKGIKHKEYELTKESVCGFEENFNCYFDLITVLGKEAFANHKRLVKINIPTNITEIRDKCFYNCQKLTKVTLPNGLKRLGNKVFNNCKNLKEIELPTSLTYIGNKCFEKCHQLTVIMSNKMMKIIDEIKTYFKKYENQVELIWKQNDDKITFHFNPSDHIIIPEGITTIDSSYFYFPEFIKTIQFPQSSVDIKRECVANFLSVESLIIPDSIASIEDELFSSLPNLTYLKLPSNLKEIPNGNFKHLTNLKTIIIPQNVTSIGNECFYNCGKIETIELPSRLLTIGENCFVMNYKLRSLTLPDSVTSIGNQSFVFCSSLTNIHLPSSLKIIGSEILNHCVHLEEIIIPENVQHIGDCFLKNCSQLTKVKFPSILKSIGKLMMFKCDEIKQLTIPNSVTLIGEYFCEDCVNLTQINVPSHLIKLNKINIVNQYNQYLKQIVTPPSPKYLESESYFFNNDITNITLLTNLEMIQKVNFLLDNIQNIIIPDSVTYIDEKCFCCCSNLTYIHLPSSLKTISRYNFRKLGSIEEIILPDTITIIDTHCFISCSALTKIQLPSSLKIIRKNCFMNCGKLKEIVIPKSVVFLDSNCFVNCSQLTKVEILNGNMGIGPGCFENCPLLKEDGIIKHFDE